MKLIVGLILVPACVLGGFVLHHGQLAALFVPTEYLIIGGCLVGGMIIKNPPHVLKSILGAVMGLLKGSGPGRAENLQLLQLLFELLELARRESVLQLEEHVNDPGKSPIIGKYESFAADHHGVAFLCDSLQLVIAGGFDAHRLDELMERDLEIIHHEEMEPSEAVGNAADSLPAIGIVAAVLGIILTMSAIDEGAAAVGSKVAGALVGTFLGVFLAYGFAGPIAGAIAASADAKGVYYQVIRHVLTAWVSGIAPNLAVEAGRRTIPPVNRPSFAELEDALRKAKG